MIVTSRERAMDMVAKPIHIAASAISTDTWRCTGRGNPLWLGACGQCPKAYEQAGITDQLNLFELHAFTIMAALSLEACGFAGPGRGWELARDNAIARNGRLPSAPSAVSRPVATRGCDWRLSDCQVARQLRGEAGDNQVANAQTGMAQNLGAVGRRR
ncbi:MAG: hypothetical protein IPL78_36285 [Chloroflexi bacterium]|nr:hypothetical protein [Chloroflexota bacterium]